MSKADNIQNKLWKAYGKVAKSLGRPFDVYRSDVLTTPLDDANYLDNKLVSFSKDNKYSSANDQNLSLWLCWIDGRLTDLFDIQQGDILHNAETSETYIIVSAQKHLPIRALRSPNTVSIARSGYSNSSNGFGPSDTEIATNVPCNIKLPSSGGGAGGYIPASNVAQSAVPNFEIHLWDPANVIQIGDAVIDEQGNRSQVLAVTITDMGTKLTTTAFEAA